MIGGQFFFKCMYNCHMDSSLLQINSSSKELRIECVCSREDEEIFTKKWITDILESRSKGSFERFRLKDYI